MTAVPSRLSAPTAPNPPHHAPAQDAGALPKGLELARLAHPAPTAAGFLRTHPLVDLSVDEAVRLIERLMEGATGPKDEAQILDVLRGAGDEALDAILSRLKLNDLVSDIDDHPWPLPNNRQTFLDLVTKERLGALSVGTRAALVHGLQAGRTDKQQELGIKNVFLGTRGTQLTELKNRIDAGPDYRDLQQLMFSDIDDTHIRADILAHISREATPPPKGLDIKLISDVDDTLYASLKDTRVAKDTVYPGLVALYEALAKSPGEGQTNLTILTARPKLPTGNIENYTKEALRKKGIPESAILSGDFLSLISDERIAAKKLQNFEQYVSLYPEYRFIWNGDSGQGDRLVGRRMLERYGDRMVSVSIHGIGERVASVAPDAIVDFSTYPGLATVLFELGLLTTAELLRVAAEAEAAPQHGFSDAFRETLARDIAMARQRASA